MHFKRICKTKPNMKWCDVLDGSSAPWVPQWKQPTHFIALCRAKMLQFEFYSLIVMSTWKCDELAGTHFQFNFNFPINISFYVIIRIKFKVTPFFRVSAFSFLIAGTDYTQNLFATESHSDQVPNVFSTANRHVFELLATALSQKFHSPWVKGWGVIFDEDKREKSWKLYFECLI